MVIEMCAKWFKLCQKHGLVWNKIWYNCHKCEEEREAKVMEPFVKLGKVVLPYETILGNCTLEIRYLSKVWNGNKLDDKVRQWICLYLPRKYGWAEERVSFKKNGDLTVKCIYLM